MLVWNVEVARSKGKLGRGERGPPPFLHADLRWRVKPAECARSQKDSQGHRHRRATVGVCVHRRKAKLVKRRNRRRRKRRRRARRKRREWRKKKKKKKMKKKKIRSSRTGLSRPGLGRTGLSRPGPKGRKRPTLGNPVLAILIWPILANPIWANPFLANPILANSILDLVCVCVWGPKGGAQTQKKWGPESQGLEQGGGVGPKPRKNRAPQGGAPQGGRPKISRFFSLSRHNCHSFCFSLGVFLVEFWLFFLKRWDPRMCTFGVLGLSCETPAALKPPGFHSTVGEPIRAFFRFPEFENTTQIQREDTQRERQRTNMRWERDKQREILGAPAEGGPA